MTSPGLFGIVMLIVKPRLSCIYRENAALDTWAAQGSRTYVLGSAEALCRELPIPQLGASR